ncbi:MAG: hypothetical protein R3E32_11495 [Chitinophagales bacterium]
MANSNCWVQFWENDSYDGRTDTYNNEQRVNNLKDEHYDGSSKDEYHSYNSLKTGPTGYLIAFDGLNLTGNSITFGPNSNVPHLDQHQRGSLGSWQNSIGSFILLDGAPETLD